MIRDLTDGRIPNSVTAAGAVCGLTGQWLLHGPGPGFSSLAGCLAPPALLGWLYLFRMIGAGDIKLFCMIGAFLGIGGSIRCMIFSFLFGGICAAYLAIHRRILFARLFYFRSYLSEFLETGTLRPYRKPEDKTGEFCFSVPILAGLLLTLGGVI